MTGCYLLPLGRFYRGTGHLFVTGKYPVLTGKHTQMTGFSRHLTDKIQVQSKFIRPVSLGVVDNYSEGLDVNFIPVQNGRKYTPRRVFPIPLTDRVFSPSETKYFSKAPSG